MWEAPPFATLQDAIRDPSNAIGMRMRAAYFLKQAYTNSSGSNGDSDPVRQEQVVQCLAESLADERHGSLMRHEYAYVMGQLGDERSCKVLETILLKDDDCSMVRHEAAEALAAIGAVDSVKVLEQTMEKTKSNQPEVYETCLLAKNLMDWKARGGPKNPDEEAPVACACMLNPYSSVDPAPPHPAHASKTDAELGDILCNPDLSIFDRYRAMFSLRNRGGEESVLQLCRSLSSDDSSALLRHEVAYVLGQLQHPASVPALAESLRKIDEHQMVRHESAEALGAIESSWEKVEAILGEFIKDENQVVRESCMVALDAADYWANNTTNGDSTTGNDDDGEEKKETMSFVQQKSLNPATNETRKETKQVLNHHFNTATA